MKLFVDDEREAPEGWTLCKSIALANHTITVEKANITHISLDHDNGDTMNGFKPVAKHIGETYKDTDWKPIITIHSANPVGAKDLQLILGDYGITSSLAAYKIGLIV